MGALEDKIKTLGLDAKANQGKSAKAQMIADIGKCTTVGQLKAELIKLVQMFDN